MLTRKIPSTGEELPVIGLGTWQTFDVGSADKDRRPLEEVLRELVALGGRLVDSSPMYGRSEEVVGAVAAKAGVHEQLFLATKVWTSGRQKGIEQMESSFRKLRAQRLDLMQVHNLVDVDTHLATLRDWKAAGRVRYIGITHYTADAHAEVEAVMRREAFDFLQINYSVVEPEAERRILPLAQEKGFQLQRFDDEATELQALIAGQVDLGGTGLLVNQRLNKSDPGKDYQVKIVLRPLHFGIGMRRGEIDKLQWLNTFVYTIKNNGELEAISRKWRGLPLENLPVF